MTDKPGYTMVPNAILDNIAHFSEAELCLLLVVVRQTVGWQKECDMISLTQFEKLTGLSRPSVNATLKRLVEMGYIERTGKGKRGVGCYRISDGLVNSVNQLTQTTSKHSSPESVNSVNQTSHGLVNSVNTQKKDSKERLKKEREARAPAQVNIDSLHEGVAAYKRLTGKRSVTPSVAAQIAAAVTDMPLWERVITAWCGKYRAENVTGMLDWYANPDKMEQRNGTQQRFNNGRQQYTPPTPEWTGWTEADTDKPL